MSGIARNGVEAAGLVNENLVALRCPNAATLKNQRMLLCILLMIPVKKMFDCILHLTRSIDSFHKIIFDRSCIFLDGVD